jgi:aminocarboxymuconate-semialdehyde decarboxylase
MYGTDYPCWEPAECLALLADLNLTDAEKQKIFFNNAKRILNLPDEIGASSAVAA